METEASKLLESALEGLGRPPLLAIPGDPVKRGAVTVRPGILNLGIWRLLERMRGDYAAECTH